MSIPDLTPPWTRIPLVHDTTDLFDPETQDALDARYGPGGGIIPLIRDTVSYTSGASLLDGESVIAPVTIAPSFLLFDVTADMACRVRMYHSNAQATADESRGAGTFPTETGPDHGCFLEAIFDSADTYTITTGALGWVASGSDVYVTLTNLSGSTATPTVDFTFLATES